MHMIDEESAHEYNPHVEMTTNTSNFFNFTYFLSFKK
jgi:hypothetical protein